MVSSPPGRWPAILWGAGAVVALAILLALIAIPLTIGLSGDRKWGYVGALILVGTFLLVLSAKAADAYLQRKDALRAATSREHL
ncbi:MAG: hypothetical protein QOF51_652 [Chloroflexota bacterium]|jgi:hypothetical protein|nr:hypothetical protein [Chloroflexota bacterium]